MGAREASRAERLRPAWRRVAEALLSPEYRAALARLTGLDVAALPLEADVCHYSPLAWLGPHLDLPDLVGNSAVLVRSERSWHAVSRVRAGCQTSRRSVVLTFCRPGAVSTMWPPGDHTPLHDYPESRLGRLVRRALGR